MYYRHGDVIIKKSKTIKGTKLKHLRLAEGEVTGHCHQITKGDADLYMNEDGVMYLRVKSEKASLYHEEHTKIDLPKGDYQITIQREYSPEGWKYVAD